MEVLYRYRSKKKEHDCAISSMPVPDSGSPGHEICPRPRNTGMLVSQLAHPCWPLEVLARPCNGKHTSADETVKNQVPARLCRLLH
ncbi:hypothetical protein JCGZ_22679 [Jatropha curcas]|uniref:Uncharacterized protein n=1 Tax=Jatropha curcas TaxID=180498 RepID=A0A067K1Z7_JATCU|nr:hypothetical protein JCGZ_22679 [Jatropha curcas]